MANPPPAPEPVEVPADELAAAESEVYGALADGELGAVDYSLPILLAEYDRRGELVEKLSVDICQVAHGASRIREENEAARRMLADERAANESYRADLARALPVVEAAGAALAFRPAHGLPPLFASALDALATAVRAACEPQR